MIRYVVCSLSGKNIGAAVCEFHPAATEQDPCWCLEGYLEIKNREKSLEVSSLTSSAS